VRIAFVAFQGSVHTRRWAGHFAARGHDVHVVTCGVGEPSDKVDYAVHDLGHPRAGKAGYLLKVAKARRVLRALAPDVVHVHWLTSYGLLALLSGVRPLVATAHGDDLLIAPGNRLLRPIVRRVLRAATLVTVPSPQMAEVARSLARPETPIEVMQYGVETERLFALGDRVRAEIPAGRPLSIVSARPLLELYRFDVLLDALALLDPEEPWSVELFGDGPERSALEARASDLGLADRVAFHGQRPAERVEEALGGADLYVSVAESDGASVALLEALALGPVPVLSDIESNRSWVEDGANGVLVRIAPDDVADGIRRARALDGRAVRERNAAIVAERADRERNLARLESMLREIVEAA
jgi:glycosyltransferase involved in cell wall biosynthesis